LGSAALRLFAAQGYEETTVDQIAAASGIARRTFFRYFRSKDEAIFPEHDDTLAQIDAVLASADPAEEPLSVVCRAITQVLRMYADSPELSVQRYRLIRQVPTLREREIASVSRYQRLFTRYLLSRFDEAAHADGDDHGPMLAEVAAAAVVAAHNHVLRRWLRAGGQGDVEATLEGALAVVRETFGGTTSNPSSDVRNNALHPLSSDSGDWLPAQSTPLGSANGAAPPGSSTGASTEEVFVAVARTDVPLPRLLATIEAALRGQDAPEEDGGAR
jgi:AcrR family transcriptional regulator